MRTGLTPAGTGHAGRRGALALLLGLVLALRVIAVPFVMAAPAPGLMAICSGGEIVYVSLDTGQPVSNGPAADPCPFFGTTAALTGAGPDPARPVFAASDIPVVLPARIVPAPRRVVAHAPRAPPLST